MLFAGCILPLFYFNNQHSQLKILSPNNRTPSLVIYRYRVRQGTEPQGKQVSHQTAGRVGRMKEIMMSLGKVTEQEALMELLDRDDQRKEETIDFLQNFWKRFSER